MEKIVIKSLKFFLLLSMIGMSSTIIYSMVNEGTELISTEKRKLEDQEQQKVLPLKKRKLTAQDNQLSQSPKSDNQESTPIASASNLFESKDDQEPNLANQPVALSSTSTQESPQWVFHGPKRSLAVGERALHLPKKLPSGLPKKFYCDICDKYLSNKFNLTKHKKSKIHKKNLERAQKINSESSSSNLD